MRKVTFIVTLSSTWLPRLVAAQCVMCKSTVVSQSGTAAYETAVKGLQVGILYLLLVPYAAVFIVGWLWYKKTRKAQDL